MADKIIPIKPELASEVHLLSAKNRMRNTFIMALQDKLTPPMIIQCLADVMKELRDVKLKNAEKLGLPPAQVAFETEVAARMYNKLVETAEEIDKIIVTTYAEG